MSAQEHTTDAKVVGDATQIHGVSSKHILEKRYAITDEDIMILKPYFQNDIEANILRLLQHLEATEANMWTVNEVAHLLGQEWFHGFVSSTATVDRLMAVPSNNLWLARFNPDLAKSFVISMIGPQNDLIHYHNIHHVVLKSTENPNSPKELTVDGDSTFNSIYDAVEYYMRHSIPQIGATLGSPCKRISIQTETKDLFSREPHGKKDLQWLISPEHEKLAQNVQLEICLNERQVCDVELLMNGGFTPLTGFMNQDTYDHVVLHYRLLDGTLWGIPVTLDTDSEEISVGSYVKLVNPEMGGLLAVLLVQSKWVPDRQIECRHVYGTVDEDHPAVLHLLKEKKKYNIGGNIFGIRLPKRSWVECKTPHEIRNLYANEKSLVAFQSRNPIHKAHASMFMEVSKEFSAAIMVHPIVGPTKSDDFPPKIRKLTYEALRPVLSNINFEYLPYNMMVGGPRECLQHIIIRKNFGCSHMIVGRDHAGCKNSSGQDYYGPYDSQDFVQSLQLELGIGVLPFKHKIYVAEKADYFEMDEAKKNGWSIGEISGTEFRRRIHRGDHIPEWFAFPEVVDILRNHYGPIAPFKLKKND